MATGLGTAGLRTTTCEPAIFASAQANFMSSPAMAKPLSGPSFATSPPPVFLKVIVALSPAIFIEANIGPE